MVSEENRRNKFAPRKKHSEERKVKLKSILEKARKVKATKPIPPLTYKQRLESLESNNNNNNNSSNNPDDEIIPMLDFLSIRIDDLEEENSKLISKIEELNNNNNNNNNSDNEEIIPMVDFLSVRIDDLEEDMESIKEVRNVPDTDQNNNNLQIEINKLNVKINALETHQVETKKDINEIFSDLNDMEDKLDN